jgi:transcriptional regulator with XRE-family HTH domain
MMTLGDRIKQRRHRLGLTQDELARRAAVLRPRIAELETNRRLVVSSDVLRRLARVLSCTTDYLVGMYEEEDDPAPALLARVGERGRQRHRRLIPCSPLS